MNIGKKLAECADRVDALSKRMDTVATRRRDESGYEKMKRLEAEQNSDPAFAAMQKKAQEHVRSAEYKKQEKKGEVQRPRPHRNLAK